MSDINLDSAFAKTKAFFELLVGKEIPLVMCTIHNEKVALASNVTDEETVLLLRSFADGISNGETHKSKIS
jgi:hypothetical protein